MNKQVQSNQSFDRREAHEETGAAGIVEGPGDSPLVRERIVREATRLFSTKGYNGVSVREIVQAAGVTKPTLYYYFPNKEALFRSIIVDSLEEFREQLKEAVAHAGAIRERLLHICRVHFDFAQRHPEHCRLAYSLYFSSERNAVDYDFDAYFTRNITMIRDVIAEGIASNELRAGDPWLMALGFTGVMNLLIMGMLYNPAVLPSDGLADTVIDLTMRGMEDPHFGKDGVSE